MQAQSPNWVVTNLVISACSARVSGGELALKLQTWRQGTCLPQSLWHSVRTGWMTKQRVNCRCQSFICKQANTAAAPNGTSHSWPCTQPVHGCSLSEDLSSNVSCKVVGWCRHSKPQAYHTKKYNGIEMSCPYGMQPLPGTKWHWLFMCDSLCDLH